MLALLAGAILGPDWSAPITTPPPGSTTLHLLPNHQCTGAGEYSDADGKHPYCTKDEARAACVAAGCDGLTGDVLGAAPRALARAFHPLLTKVQALAQEPLAQKGGLVFEVWF